MSGVVVQLPSDSRRDAVYRERDAVHRELAQGESLSFGRGAPNLKVDLRLDNPTVPRLAGEILAVEDHWRLSNLSESRAYVVENPEGGGEYLRVPPRRASYPIPFEFSRIVLSAQGEISSFQVYAPQHLYVESTGVELIEMGGTTTMSAFSLNVEATYFLILVALCEPRLLGRSFTAVPTSRQIAERLSVRSGRQFTQRAVNFHIDYLAEQKLRVKQPFEEERQDGKRTAVVDTALRFGLVQKEHLSLLP